MELKKGQLLMAKLEALEPEGWLLRADGLPCLLPPSEGLEPNLARELGARARAVVVTDFREMRRGLLRRNLRLPVVSWRSPEVVTKLLEAIVPEIRSGAVQLQALAREPGWRTKIAVHSNEPTTDPVKACEGEGGTRLRRLTEALGPAEAVELVPWDSDPAAFVCNALTVEDVIREVVVDDETRAMILVVADDSFDRVVGDQGLNVRLAEQLTGWRLSALSELLYRSEGEVWPAEPPSESEDVTSRYRELAKTIAEAIDEARLGIQELEVTVAGGAVGLYGTAPDSRAAERAAAIARRFKGVEEVEIGFSILPS